MVTAAAIVGAAQLAIKRTSRKVVVVVGEYPIIELCIRVAIVSLEIISNLIELTH